MKQSAVLAFGVGVKLLLGLIGISAVIVLGVIAYLWAEVSLPFPELRFFDKRILVNPELKTFGCRDSEVAIIVDKFRSQLPVNHKIDKEWHTSDLLQSGQELLWPLATPDSKRVLVAYPLGGKYTFQLRKISPAEFDTQILPEFKTNLTSLGYEFLPIGDVAWFPQDEGQYRRLSFINHIAGEENSGSDIADLYLLELYQSEGQTTVNLFCSLVGLESDHPSQAYQAFVENSKQLEQDSVIQVEFLTPNLVEFSVQKLGKVTREREFWVKRDTGFQFVAKESSLDECDILKKAGVKQENCHLQ